MILRNFKTSDRNRGKLKFIRLFIYTIVRSKQISPNHYLGSKNVPDLEDESRVRGSERRFQRVDRYEIFNLMLPNAHCNATVKTCFCVRSPEATISDIGIPGPSHRYATGV